MGLFSGKRITHVRGHSFIKWDNIAIALFCAWLLYMFLTGG